MKKISVYSILLLITTSTVLIVHYFTPKSDPSDEWTEFAGLVTATRISMGNQFDTICIDTVRYTADGPIFGSLMMTVTADPFLTHMTLQTRVDRNKETSIDYCHLQFSKHGTWEFYSSSPKISESRFRNIVRSLIHTLQTYPVPRGQPWRCNTKFMRVNA